MTDQELAAAVIEGLRETLPAENRDLLNCAWDWHNPLLYVRVHGHSGWYAVEYADPNSLYRAEQWLASINWDKARHMHRVRQSLRRHLWGWDGESALFDECGGDWYESLLAEIDHILEQEATT